MFRSRTGSPPPVFAERSTLGDDAHGRRPEPRLETENARHRDWNNYCHPNFGLEMETALRQT